ncbi:helix-hairpin-helix domain-containing protein [Paenisporosarcina quisquiliarum]|uniref:helix-hairpin-helix domain-containing protein n=1 Tax=Paenisporosarcina quisquiliarum TaxID=365346 RepID=UPI003735F183
MKQTDENVVSKDSSLQLTSTVVVDVKGQVALPGVYTLSANKRVLDAITLAGGLLPTADERMLNLAAKLVDEMVIYVPNEGEQTSFSGPIVQVPEASSDSDLININASDENELMTLSGIGPSKAKAIIIYREENGLFKSIEQLKEVSGIGDQTFEAIKDFISIN